MNYQVKTKAELIKELQKLQQETEALKTSYSKDIAECIQLHEEQRVSEKYYRTLFDAVDEGFCIIEVIFDNNEKPIDYRFLLINPSFEKQTGLVNALGKRMRELAPKHEEHWFDIYGKIALTGQPARFENRAVQLHRWYDVYAFRFGPPQNRQVAILFNDITERKLAGEKIRAASLYARNLIEASLDPLVTISKDGKITDVNFSTEQITGIKRNKLIGSDFADYFKESDKAREGYSIVFSKGVVKDYPLTIIHTSGREIAVLYNATLFRNEAGEVQGVFAAARDITEQKKMEEELRKSKKLLEKLNEHLVDVRENERNQIGLNLHDDLGQKLTALNLDIAWLKSRIGVQSKAVSEKLENMNLMIKETIEGIRETSYFLRPAILFDLGLGPAINSQLGKFENQTGIKCHFYSEPEEFVLEDRLSLIIYRILQESLTNIARHSGASTVEVNLRILKKKIEMLVEDDGCGIEKSKVDSLRSMGIAGMKERVKSVQGKITFRGERGSGTRIKVIVPLINEKNDD